MRSGPRVGADRVGHQESGNTLGFFIRTPGPEFWGHPHPHGEPQHQQGQGLILEQFIEEILLGIVRLVNFFHPSGHMGDTISCIIIGPVLGG